MKFKPEDSEYEIIVGTQSRLMYPINSPATETKTVIQMISIETANAKLAEWLTKEEKDNGLILLVDNSHVEYANGEKIKYVLVTGERDVKPTHKGRLVMIEKLEGGV